MAIVVVAISIGSLLTLGSAGQGNGAPPGAHFDLNIIGVKDASTFPCSEASGGNVIFVPLNTAGVVDITGKHAVDIFLQAGSDFAVLKDEALGRTGCQSALFQLPLVVAGCGVSGSVTSTSGCTTSTIAGGGTTTTLVGGQLAYEVWARVEGIPKGSGTITTCGVTGTTTLASSTTTTSICSLNQLIISTRGDSTKKNFFMDVTSLLTSVCFFPTTTITTQVSCVPIFSPTFQGFFWQYDNTGNKVLQLRFYPCSDPQLSCPGFGI